MSLIRKSTLPSGIPVLTEQVPDVESSSVGVWVKTGSRFESRKTGGVSHFIEHLLFKGTDKRSVLDISRDIESVGGVLNAFTGREYTCFYVKVLNKYLDLAADLLSDILMHSRFDPEQIERERMVVLQEIKMVEDTPDDLVHDLFAERFWKNHALGRPILGTRKTIGRITRAEILDYMARHYRPENILITAAGGVVHDRLVKLLEPSFGKMEKGGITEEESAPEAEPGVKIVRKDLEQVHLCMGVPVCAQPDPDRYKVHLLNTILGGGMSSRLFQEIRENRGLAYSVFSYPNLCKDAGFLSVYAGVERENFKEVAGLILKEFAKLRRGVTDRELKGAKEQLKGGMLLGLETSDNRMVKLARDTIYLGKPVSVRTIVREINRVTADDLKELARKAFRKKNITLVAVGGVTRRNLPDGFG